jgi:phosphoglycolate phosphatase
MSSLYRPELVLIDVDGTLVDSVPDLAYCVDEMMTALELPVHGEAKVREWVGNGVERLVRRALIGKLDGEPDDALFEKAYPIFIELYAANTCERSTLYKGVAEGLEYLQSAGFKLGCVTNKAEQFTLPILDQLDIHKYFSFVVSGDTLLKKKPDPMPLLHVAEHFGIRPEKSLMLGDSSNDVQAARAAGFQIICMTYGYNHGIDIRESAPDAVIDSMAELQGLLDAAEIKKTA